MSIVWFAVFCVTGLALVALSMIGIAALVVIRALWNFRRKHVRH